MPRTRATRAKPGTPVAENTPVPRSTYDTSPRHNTRYSERRRFRNQARVHVCMLDINPHALENVNWSSLRNSRPRTPGLARRAVHFQDESTDSNSEELQDEEVEEHLQYFEDTDSDVDDPTARLFQDEDVPFDNRDFADEDAEYDGQVPKEPFILVRAGAALGRGCGRFASAVWAERGTIAVSLFVLAAIFGFYHVISQGLHTTAQESVQEAIEKIYESTTKMEEVAPSIVADIPELKEHITEAIGALSAGFVQKQQASAEAISEKLEGKLVARVSEIHAEFKGTLETVRDLHTQVAAVSERADGIAEAKALIGTLDSRLTAAVASLADGTDEKVGVVSKALHAAINEAKSAVERVQAGLSEQESTGVVLHEAIDSVRKDVAGVGADLARLETEVGAATQGAIDATKAELLTAMEQESGLLSEGLADLRAEVNLLAETVAALPTDAPSAPADAPGPASDSGLSKHDVDRLRASMAERIDKLETKYSASVEDIRTKLSGFVEEGQSASEGASSRMQQLESSVASASAEAVENFASLKSDIDGLRAAIEHQAGDIAEKVKSLADIRAAADDASATSNDAIGKASEARSAADDAALLARKSEDSVAAVEAKMESVQSGVESMGATLGDVTAETKKATKEAVDAAAAAQSAMAEASAAAAAATTASSDAAKANEGLESLAARLLELTNELESTRSDVESSKSDLASTKSDLASTKSDLASTKSDLASTKSDLESTKSDVESGRVAEDGASAARASGLEADVKKAIDAVNRAEKGAAEAAERSSTAVSTAEDAATAAEQARSAAQSAASKAEQALNKAEEALKKAVDSADAGTQSDVAGAVDELRREMLMYMKEEYVNVEHLRSELGEALASRVTAHTMDDDALAATVELAVRKRFDVDNLKRGSDGAHGGADVSEDRIRILIEEALERYSADTVAEVDFANEMMGGSVEWSETSRSYQSNLFLSFLHGIDRLAASKTAGTVLFVILGGLVGYVVGALLSDKKWARIGSGDFELSLDHYTLFVLFAVVALFVGLNLKHYPPPEVVIQAKTTSNAVGKCYAFGGSTGQIMIRPFRAVVPRAFSLEHISKLISPDASTAPRKFRVVGYGPNTPEGGVVLGDYEYKLEASRHVQTFEVEAPKVPKVDKVALVVRSNHGNPLYTCVYRFRIHA